MKQRTTRMSKLVPVAGNRLVRREYKVTYAVGSNQYKKRRNDNWGLNLFRISFPLILIVLYLYVAIQDQVHAQDNMVKAEISYIYVNPTATPTPQENLTERQQIDSYIQETFGADAAKFNKLLDCENHARNPLAKNYNHENGSTEVTSIDWGIAQINDKWQGVSNPAFLTDWKINIQMAHNIFMRSGKSFKMWACAKKVGLN